MMAMQLGCQLSRAHTCKPTATVAHIGLRKASQVHDTRTCKCAPCCRVRATGIAGVGPHVSAGSCSGSNLKNSLRSRIYAAASSSALPGVTVTPSFASPVEEVEEPVIQTVLIPTLLAGASLVGCAVLVAGMGVCEATCLGSLQWTQLTSSALFCGYYLSYMGQQVEQRLPPSDRSLLAQNVLDNAPAWRPFLQGLAVSHMLHVAILSYATAFFPPAVYAFDAVCSVVVTGLLAGICWTELGHQGRNLQNASFTSVGTMVMKVALLATSVAAVATKFLASSQIPAFAAVSTAILLPNIFLPTMLRV